MPWPPLPNGNSRPLAVPWASPLPVLLPRGVVSALLGVALMFLVGAQTAQAQEAIDYDLAVAFDLNQQTLQGLARLSVPDGQGLTLDLTGLAVTALEVNGRPEPLPNTGVVTLVPGAAQRLSVHYQKAFRGSASNLISPNGIALTDSWHPQPDRDCRFHLQVSLPAAFEAVSEADRIDTEITACGKTQRFTLGQLLPAITLVAGPYVVAKDTFANGKTLYSYFFAEDAELAASYRAKALAYLKRYQELIGPYPYERFSIVENRLPTGFAMAAYTLLGQSVVRLPFITDTSLGHEILHSWFGNAVRVDQSQGNWCEGLTTYLADQAFAVDRGDGATFRREELLKYQHYVLPAAAIPVKEFHGANQASGMTEQAVRAVGYGKVAMIFRMLELKIGHERFVAGLRQLYQTMNGKEAGWDSVAASFEQKKDELKPFFAQWLSRDDLPTITAEKLNLEEKDGVLTLSFTLHQAGKTPYQLEVPILIVAGSSVDRQVVATSTIDHPVVLALEQHPSTLVIDPDYEVMRVPATTEVPPSWDWFNGAAKKLAVVNSSAEYDLYQPLIDQLEAQGAEIMAANEVTDAELGASAVIFLGISGPAPRALFANPNHPATGMTVDIHRNPLNPLYPMVLVSASTQTEVAAGLRKLSHYGRYGYLHFDNGRATEKLILKAALGMSYGLDDDPLAIEVAPAAQSFITIMEQLAAKEVIYVGEAHTRYEDHKLQLRVIRDLFHRGRPLAIGMEMFPHAAQPALDAFINGTIDEAQFIKQSKYFEVWSFDYRLYREILNFARHHKIPVIALNIEREQVSKVYKQGGIAGLSPEEMATLPVDRDLDAPGYRERIHEVYAQHPGRDDKQFAGFFQSQAIWDEVMAQTIADALASHPERQLVVLAGNGHVVKDNAIPPRVARRRQVDQAVVMASDGAAFNPAEVDYLVFMPPYELAPQPKLGIVMNRKKDAERITLEEVMPQSPADKAGIKKGDILLALDGKKMREVDDVKILLIDKKIGDTVKVTVLRARTFSADQELTLDVTL